MTFFKVLRTILKFEWNFNSPTIQIHSEKKEDRQYSFCDFKLDYTAIAKWCDNGTEATVGLISQKQEPRAKMSGG